MTGDPRFTRRAVLLGALAVPLAACRRHSSGRSPAVVDPDRSAILEAVAMEEQLVQAADAFSSTARPGGDMHADHMLTLRGLLHLSTAPSASPSPPGPPVLKSFDQAVAATVPRLQYLALSAVQGQTAAVLASIAASHASPPPVLFRGEWYGAGA
jgi:hypothetical protein